MRRACYLVGVSGLLLGAGLLRSGEQPNPRQILDQAIKAHGGEQNLAKYKAATMKDKGTFYGVVKEGLPYASESAVQGHRQLRFTVEMTIKGEAHKLTEVVNGGKGWRKVAGQETKPLSKEELREEQAEMYAGWLAQLAPIKGEEFKLSPVGEVRVDGKPALGVRVEHKGHPGVSLFFDRQSHLLVKSEFPVKDAQAGGRPVMQEVFFKGYKDVQGVQQPTRLLINRDGKRFLEAEITDIRLHESLPPSTFAEP